MKGEAEHEGVVKWIEFEGLGLEKRGFLKWVSGDEDDGSFVRRAMR